MGSLFDIGMAAGGAGQGIMQTAQTYGMVKSAQQRQQLIQLEQQKQNVTGWTTLRDMMNNMTPDTFNSMLPTLAKMTGSDPADPQFKNMVKQMGDSQSQLGEAARTYLNSANMGDIAKNMPLNSLAKMASDPGAMNTFIKGSQDIKMQQQALQLTQGAM